MITSPHSKHAACRYLVQWKRCTLPTSGSLRTQQNLSASLRCAADGLYFADQRVFENPSEFLTTIRYLKSRQELLNDAYAVQTTAYALLSYIRQEKQDSNTTSMMEWLNTMRNTDGGFASTQVGSIRLAALPLWWEGVVVEG